MHICIKPFYFMLTYTSQEECHVYYLHVLSDTLYELSCLSITNRTHVYPGV
jgi:hypothetical protein